MGYLLKITVFFCLVGQGASASSLIKASCFSFKLDTPVGWSLDTHYNIPANKLAIAMPYGQFIDDCTSVVYVSESNLFFAHQPLEHFIASDLGIQKKRVPDVILTSRYQLFTSQGLRVPVCTFKGDKGKSHESVAYIREKDKVILIVLMSVSEHEMVKALPAFRKIVISYRKASLPSKIQRIAVQKISQKSSLPKKMKKKKSKVLTQYTDHP